jgi:hypothetical protein
MYIRGGVISTEMALFIGYGKEKRDRRLSPPRGVRAPLVTPFQATYNKVPSITPSCCCFSTSTWKSGSLNDPAVWGSREGDGVGDGCSAHSVAYKSGSPPTPPNPCRAQRNYPRGAARHISTTTGAMPASINSGILFPFTLIVKQVVCTLCR